MKFISENPILFILLACILVIAIVCTIDLYLDAKSHKKHMEDDEQATPQEKNKVAPKTSHDELMKILDSTIDKEIYFWLKLTVNMKDVKIIDFEQTLTTLSDKTYNALSKNYLSDLSYFYNDEWVMRYIVRTIKIYITDYIRSHPVG